MLESEMTEQGIAYFVSQEKYKLVKREIPFLSRCIDVVLLDDENKIISIEFKVNNWRHAIEQAKNHKLGADKAYICIPKRKISESFSNAIKDAGIGLMEFDPNETEIIHEVISAPNEASNIPVFRNILRDNVINID